MLFQSFCGWKNAPVNSRLGKSLDVIITAKASSTGIRKPRAHPKPKSDSKVTPIRARRSSAA